MKLQPEWFRNGYYVYVVVVEYQEKKYYYVGMTGDRKHFTARSPFYRMGGHFMLGKSTQNQIIKGIEKKFDVIVKDDSNILCDMDISYYAWLINEYNRADEAKHHEYRTIGEKIESALIAACKKQFGEDYLFNSKPSRKNFAAYQETAEQILAQLNKLVSSNYNFKC